MKFEDNVRDDIDKLMFLLVNSRRIILEKIDLYKGQPIILKLIEDNPGLSQKEFAKIARISPPTLNVMAGRLAKKGLIEIKDDENNLKIRKLYLTEKGKEKSFKAQEEMGNLREHYYKGFSDDEIETFKKLLKKVNINLENKLKEVENESN